MSSVGCIDSPVFYLSEFSPGTLKSGSQCGGELDRYSLPAAAVKEEALLHWTKGKFQGAAAADA